MYGAGERLTKTKLFLERIEVYGHKEVPTFEDVTIEHILPQTMSSGWKEHLGAEAEEAQELWLHSLGNLTLTGYNPELSNSTFDEKKRIYARSNIHITRSVAEFDRWTVDSIKTRGEQLADKALSIWRYFGPKEDPPKVEDLRNRIPVRVTVCGQSYDVKTWRDVGQVTLEAICDFGADAADLLVREMPRFVSEDGVGFRSMRQLNNGLFMETNLSAKYFHRLCMQATAFVGLSPDDWRLETVDAGVDAGEQA